jgi:DNA-binding NtrC family response regulator
MKRLFTRIAQIASSSSTVLIEGKTGTGKDIIAETIHMKSARAHCPFVTFDCARVTPTLMESELFGHVRGAFTGADAHRSGILETAHGGTVFFDEMGELPLELQPKLLRALEKRELSRVGSAHSRRIDVRIIAATNRDLKQMVAQGQFRSDLYYRLNVMKVHVPALRDRVEDIDLLATHFLRQIIGNPEATLPGEVLGRMERYDWPGNIRELRTAVERWHVLATSRRLHDIEIFGNERLAGSAGIDGPDDDISFRDMKSKAVDEWERCFLDKLIRRHDGNISKAARAAQMNRNHLTLLLRRHGVAA